MRRVRPGRDDPQEPRGKDSGQSPLCLSTPHCHSGTLPSLDRSFLPVEELSRLNQPTGHGAWRAVVYLANAGVWLFMFQNYHYLAFLRQGFIM